jgi:hypothetical protein
MIRKLGLVVFFFLSGVIIYAQNEDDALRYGYLHGVYSNRAIGMGGAFASLGGDVINCFQNPAGLSAYKTGVFDITISGLSSSSQTTFLNNSEESNTFSLPVDAMSMIFQTGTGENGWSPTYVGIGFGVLQKYNKRTDISSTDDEASLLDVFANQLNYYQVPTSEITSSFPFSAGLAWETYLILDPVGGVYNRISNTGAITRRDKVEESGQMKEWNLSVSKNYKNTLYLGCALALRRLRYTKETTYTESYSSGQSMVSYEYSSTLNNSGVGSDDFLGLQLKLGMQYAPSPYFRVGAYYHSGVKQGIFDSFEAGMNSQIGSSFYEYNSDLNEYTYGLKLPPVIGMGASFIAGNFGVVSVDYESTDLSKMEMKSLTDVYTFALENDAIHDNYQVVHTLRGGIEFRLADLYRLRCGLNAVSSPVENLEKWQMKYAIGAGYRKDDLFYNLALSYMMRSNQYYMFDPNLIAPTSVKMSTLGISVSGGFRF